MKVLSKWEHINTFKISIDNAEVGVESKSFLVLTKRREWLKLESGIET